MVVASAVHVQGSRPRPLRPMIRREVRNSTSPSLTLGSGGNYPMYLAGDTRTMKTDKKGALRLQTHLLLDRPAIDWLRRT